MTRICRVDKRVKISSLLRLWYSLRLKLLLLSYWSWLLSYWSWLLSDRSRPLSYLSRSWLFWKLLSSCNFWIKRSTLKTSGAFWNMGTFQYPEPILPCRVSHSDGLTILINVAVLTNSLTISSCLLSEHGPILLSKGSTKSPISSIKSLLFQNFSIFGINILA